jgi:hypothetical protein
LNTSGWAFSTSSKRITWCHRCAVAADAPFALRAAKDSKAADPHLITVLQRAFDAGKHRLDDAHRLSGLAAHTLSWRSSRSPASRILCGEHPQFARARAMPGKVRAGQEFVACCAGVGVASIGHIQPARAAACRGRHARARGVERQ